MNKYIITKMERKIWSVLAVLAVLTIGINCFTGTSSTPYMQLPVYVTLSSTSFISINLTLNSKFYPLLMKVSLAGYPGLVSAVSLLHSAYNQTDMDLQGVLIGRSQIVNINTTGLPVGSSVFISVMNYVAPTSISFGYVITQVLNPICSACSNGGTPVPGPYCLCRNCPLNYQGNYCDVQTYTLTPSNKQQLTFFGPQYYAIIIPSQNSIKTYYQITGSSANFYIQFKNFDSEIAGILNYASSSASFVLSGTESAATEIDISAQGSSIIIGIVKSSNTAASVTIWFDEVASTNVLAIVLGVLGGILFIALVIAAIYIARRVRSGNNVVNPNMNSIRVGMPANQNSLTEDEIQQYFPTVLFRDVFAAVADGESMLNLNPLNNINNDTPTDKDCVICLSPVEAQQMMKGTYCRHIFHANCLTNWFKKQKNCPYCREEFTKAGTIKLYQNLLVKAGNLRILATIELVRAIFKYKPSKSNIVVEDMKEEENQQ